MIGKTFGRLTILKAIPAPRYGGRRYKCQCSCGNICFSMSSSIRKGKTKSCGCLKTETIIAQSKKNITHGKHNTAVYYSWRAMKERCLLKTHKQYRHYGGRGITVCQRWMRFENFYEDMGDPSGLTLDRIDNNKGYSKENCRWATMLEQSNNKRTNIFIKYQDRRMTLAELSREVGISHDTLWRRYKAGKSGDELVARVDPQYSRMGRTKKKTLGCV